MIKRGFIGLSLLAIGALIWLVLIPIMGIGVLASHEFDRLSALGQRLYDALGIKK